MKAGDGLEGEIDDCFEVECPGAGEVLRPLVVISLSCFGRSERANDNWKLGGIAASQVSALTSHFPKEH